MSCRLLLQARGLGRLFVCQRLAHRWAADDIVGLLGDGASRDVVSLTVRWSMLSFVALDGYFWRLSSRQPGRDFLYVFPVAVPA